MHKVHSLLLLDLGSNPLFLVDGSCFLLGSRSLLLLRFACSVRMPEGGEGGLTTCINYMVRY